MKTVISSFLSLIILVFATCNMPSLAKDATATGAETVKVKGYTKKDGTKVEGYERKKNSKTEAAPADDMQQVKGYTKKDGTKVAGYTRKKATKASK